MEPMMDPIGKIRELFKEIVNRPEEKPLISGYITVAEVFYIIALCRQILEVEDVKKDFSILNLYANWALHVKLTNREAEKFLALIFECFSEHRIGKDIKKEEEGLLLSLKISNSLSMVKLREEFLNLFSKYEIPVVGFGDEQNWHHFSENIFKIILGNVIEVSDVEKVLNDNKKYVRILHALNIDRLDSLKFFVETTGGIEGEVAGWSLQTNEERIYSGTLFNSEKLKGLKSELRSGPERDFGEG